MCVFGCVCVFVWMCVCFDVCVWMCVCVMTPRRHDVVVCVCVHGGGCDGYVSWWRHVVVCV